MIIIITVIIVVVVVVVVELWSCSFVFVVQVSLMCVRYDMMMYDL